MADDKIDPALVRLTSQPQHYLEGFFQKGDPGHVVIWTSTCVDMPARVPVHTETQTTPLIYKSIAAEFDWRPSWCRTYQQRLQDVGELYDRSAGTVKKALKLFPNLSRCS